MNLPLPIEYICTSAYNFKLFKCHNYENFQEYEIVYKNSSELINLELEFAFE
jgi:hypothetical protein